MVDFDEGREARLHTTLRTGGAADGGISVRDYFAARAMQSLVARPDAPKEVNESWFAKFAYEMADAMMAERSKVAEENRQKYMSAEEAFGL